MDVQDVIAQTRDALTVKKVFGEPYEKSGVTMIPVARVQGGAGGGGGVGILCHPHRDRVPGRGRLRPVHIQGTREGSPPGKERQGRSTSKVSS